MAPTGFVVSVGNTWRPIWYPSELILGDLT